MDLETESLQKNFITHEIKDELQVLGFTISTTQENGVMWGLDGKTQYFPRDTYIKEEENGMKIKLRIEKTINGFILIINSIPFKPQNHLNRSELSITEVMPIVKEYINLIKN